MILELHFNLYCHIIFYQTAACFLYLPGSAQPSRCFGTSHRALDASVILTRITPAAKRSTRRRSSGTSGPSSGCVDLDWRSNPVAASTPSSAPNRLLLDHKAITLGQPLLPMYQACRTTANAPSCPRDHITCLLFSA